MGQAFYLNGTNASVEVPANGSLDVGTNNGFTVEGWINPSVVDTTGRPIVEWNNGSAWGVHFWISVPPHYGTGAGCLFANLVDTGGYDHYLSSAAGLVQAGVYQHVALTYDRGSGLATIYLNGVLVAQQNLGSNFIPQTSYDFYLGMRPSAPPAAWVGSLDEFSVYNRALSSNEIAAIYLAGSGGKCFSPTAPVITAQPANETVVAGQTATFSVSATGTPPLSYQWTFNTINIAEATNAMLVLTNVQSNQAGVYAVTVSNLAGSVISSNATLTVLAPPPSPSNRQIRWSMGGAPPALVSPLRARNHWVTSRTLIKPIFRKRPMPHCC